MTWRIQLGENRFKLRPSYVLSDDIQQLLWTVIGFHPDYDEAIWGMANFRQSEYFPCEKLNIDEEGSKAVWDISINEEKNTRENRVLHIKIYHDLNILQHTYEADVPYFEFASEIMRAVDNFLRGVGLIKYYREWGIRFR